MSYAPDFLAMILKMAAALLIVLGGVLAFYYVTRRVIRSPMSGFAAQRPVRVLANCYVGTRKNVSLVEVPGAVLVLGITSDSIRLLDKIEDDALLGQLKMDSRGNAPPSFADQLHKISSLWKAGRREA